MKTSVSNYATSGVRLQRLERQCNQLKLALLAMPVVAGLLGFASADMADWKGKSVTTEKLTLVDSNGRPRAVLQVTADGPTFRLLNEDQSFLVSIGKAKSRIGAINFFDDRGNFAMQEGGRKAEGN